MSRVRGWSKFSYSLFVVLVIAAFCFSLLPSPIPFGGAGVASATTCADEDLTTYTTIGTIEAVLTSGTSWTIPAGVTAIQVLTVAGGGGGGYQAGGGGGAGGVVYTATYTFSAAEIAAGHIHYAIGNGGAGSTAAANKGTSGSSSTFGDGTATTPITAVGGGGGGSQCTEACTADNGADGGSGGGGTRNTAGSAGSENQNPNQGYNGGAGGNGVDCYGTGGGGGGAGAVGTAGINCYGGAGGIGADYSAIFSSTFGDPSYRGWVAGGGGGGVLWGTKGAGGKGGGGASGEYTVNATVGGTNTGGGGGGGGSTGGGNGATGGSGVIVIRYISTSSHPLYTISSGNVTFTNLPRNENNYVYKDFGANYFSNNFIIYEDVMLTSADVNSLAYSAVLANTIGSMYTIYFSGDGNSLNWSFQHGNVSSYTITLAEVHAGVGYASAVTINLDTIYYLKIFRNESVGMYGALILDVYSTSVLRNAGATGDVGRASLTLHAKHDFRYLYSLNTYNDGTTPKASGYIKNLIVCAPPTVILYPATGTGGTSVDGYVARHGVNENWGNITSGVGTGASNTEEFLSTYVNASTTTNQWAQLSRGILTFPTGNGSLPGNATIVSAELILYGYAKFDGLGCTPSINIYGANPTSNSTLVAADYLTLGSIAFSTPISYANWNDGTPGISNNFVLNSSGIAAISLTGVSKFGLRNNYDVSGIPPSWSSGQGSDIEPWSADKGVAYSPRLVITYNVNPTISSISISYGNIGSTYPDIVLMGYDFAPSATLDFGSGITINSQTWVSNEVMKANITITNGASLGLRNVTVTQGSYSDTINYTVLSATLDAYSTITYSNTTSICPFIIGNSSYVASVNWIFGLGVPSTPGNITIYNANSDWTQGTLVTTSPFQVLDTFVFTFPSVWSQKVIFAGRMGTSTHMGYISYYDFGNNTWVEDTNANCLYMEYITYNSADSYFYIMPVLQPASGNWTDKILRSTSANLFTTANWTTISMPSWPFSDSFWTNIADIFNGKYYLFRNSALTYNWDFYEWDFNSTWTLISSNSDNSTVPLYNTNVAMGTSNYMVASVETEFLPYPLYNIKVSTNGTSFSNVLTMPFFPDASGIYDENSGAISPVSDTQFLIFNQQDQNAGNYFYVYDLNIGVIAAISTGSGLNLVINPLIIGDTLILGGQDISGHIPSLSIITLVTGISNTPSLWSVGVVQPSQTYWANGAEPGWPLSTSDCWGNLTNNSSFAVDISASMTNMIGGTTWTIGSSPGTNIFTLKIGIAGKANVGNFTTLSNTPVAWITSMAAGNMTRWTMVFYTPTNSPQFADGVPKSGNMTFEAEAS